MESVNSFMEVFQRSWKEGDNDPLVSILKYGNNYFKNVPKSEGERALDIVFEKERGLLKFIQSKLQSNNLAQVNGAVKEAFTTLQWIMEFFKNDYEPYIDQTRDLCCLCMKTICWYYLRKTAAETLKKLIELFHNHDLSLNTIVHHYIDSYSRLYSVKDGCVFYIVLGAIAKYCPTTESMSNSANAIYMQILRDLKSQFKKDGPKQPEEVKIYVECLSNMLVNYVPYEGSEKQQVYFEKLYFYISELCEPMKAQKTFRSVTLCIFSSQMKHFSPFITKDYLNWHKLLNNILKEADNYIAYNAVRTFYKTMGLNIIEEDRNDIFLYFKNYLIMNFENQSLSSNKMRLIVYGLGEFAAAYAKYLPAEMYEIFQMIAVRALPFHEKEEMDKDFEAITDYLQTLSKLLIHMPGVTAHQMNVVIELSICLTKKFPQYKDSFQKYSTNVLKITFGNISKLDRNLQSEFFTSFFREGILWSCSHALLIDVEFQREIEPDQENLSYKNYLPLWQALFQVDDIARFEIDDTLFLQIFDNFVRTLMTFIDKLNLNLTIEENECFSNPLLSMKAVNETDYRFFINLTDLYADIFDSIDSVVFQNWTERLFIYFIKSSYRHPLVSGFYKFIEVMFKKPDVFTDYEETLNRSTRDLITQYLTDVVTLVPTYSGELQLSCINLILSIPSLFASDLTDKLVAVCQIAFHLGLTNLSLAFYALETLENWSSNITFTSEFFTQIVFFLEPYLSSEESSVGMFEGARKKEKNTKDFILNVDDNLEVLQKKILLFYGSLDSNILFDFVHQRTVVTNATWNKKDLLQCELLYSDCRLEIYYDKFILRIIDLTTSGDRQTKLSACEFLHSMISIILGKKLMDQCFNKNLCRTILSLGCDSDDVIRNLYHPLVIQLTHFLSSQLMRESRAPQDFLDCLFEGLSEEFNPSLKDYCGIYLKEFTQWSIKQSTENNLTLVPNIKSILRRISNVASYPSEKNQRAAAVAFNYIHTLLAGRQNDIINTYWLEFLYVFVKSMEQSCGIEIMTTVDYIEEDIKMKSNIFVAKSPYRRKIACFGDETLKGALIWLFDECGSLNVKCRLRRMRLFENLFAVITDRSILKDVLAKSVHKIALKNLKADITIENAEVFLRSLDFYVWVLQKEIASTSFFLADVDKSTLFTKCFFKFITKITDEGKESLENIKIFDLFGEISLKILEYALIMLQINDHNPMVSISCNDFYLLLSRCILNPSAVGLTAKKLELIEKLPGHLQSLLTSIIDKPEGQKCREIILNDSYKNLSQFTDFQGLIGLTKDAHALRDFVQGLIILKKCKFIDFEKELDFDVEWVEERLKELFGTLKVEIMCEDSCKKLDDNVKSYLDVLLNFLLYDCQNQILKSLIRLIMNDDALLCPNGSTIPHGEYFLETFKTPLIHCLISSPSDTLKIIDDSLIQSPNKSFLIIEELLRFAKTRENEILFDEIIQRFGSLKRQINTLPHRQEKFLSIYRIAVTLKKKPAKAVKNSELYWWILEELSSASDLEKKNAILRNFLVCLVDEESDVSPELSMIFRQLRHHDSAACIRDFNSNEAVKFQAASCLQILSKSLIATKSLTVFEALLKFSAGILKSIFKGDTRDYLSPYFSSISDATSLKSLNLAYKTFMDLSLPEDRLDILHHFLLPSIECSNFDVVNSFYTETHADMASIISTNVVYDNSSDTVKLSTSKLGCFNIFETLFARFTLPIVHINSKAINQILVQQSLEIRRTKADRLLHCAALNCCIALVSLKDEQKYYKFVFTEDRRKDQLLWERIVDCNRKYTFTEDSSSIRKERKKLLNIRRKTEPTLNAYPRKLVLTSLTLLENVHAYDLNDTRLLAQPKTDRLLGLSFENDELNDHECMPMLVGLLVHMFDNAIASTDSTEELPDFLKMFRNGFGTQKDNARLFLLRILGNVKQAFLPFMTHFFLAVVSTLSSYLSNNALNYVVRDTLLILVEAKTRPTSDQEKSAANRLIQRLIERSPEGQDVLTRYNISLLDSLWTLWCEDIPWPGEAAVKSHLAARISLVILRSQAVSAFAGTNEAKSLRDLVVTSLEQTHVQESENNVIAGFETLGWLLKLNVAEESLIMKLDLLLVKMEIKSVERCAKCVCAFYRGCSSEEACKRLFRFTSRLGRLNDSTKPQCIELFTRRLEKLDPNILPAELSLLNLKPLLLNHVLSCEGPILSLLEKLAPLLPDNELKPFVEVVSSPYFSEPQCCLSEHRRKAYRFLGVANCLKPLIRALAIEPSDELRRELLDFWTVKLPAGCQDRLVEILKLYEPNVSFSKFVCLLMLELTKKAPENKRAMFRPLNDEVVFREYELLVPWRRRNLASCAPLFLPSLASASQMLQHKQIASSCNSQFSQGSYWQPLMSYGNTATLPEPSRNKLSRRTFTERLSQEGYHEKLRREAKRKVGMRRSYRIGELPDIEITQETLVEGLQQMVVKDWQCCRQMTVGILETLISRARDDENETRRDQFLNAVTSTIEKSTDDFGPILLEAVLHCKELLKKVDVTAAARVCHTLGHHSLATLLLEHRLIANEESEEDSRPSKLPRLENGDDERETWAELANLYRAIESSDVVSGIFSRPGVFSGELRQAALAHAAAEWLEAKKAYQLAYDEGPSSEKQYCFEGALECLAKLGSWSKVTQKLEDVDVRTHSRKEYLLPRLIESQLHRALDELTSNEEVSNREFIRNLDTWLADSRLDFPEQMCVFYLCGNDSQNSARHALKHAVDRLRNRWVQLDEKKPAELRAVYNIYAYVQVLKSQDVEEAARELMKEWEVKGPQVGQDLLGWNKLVGYRLTFAHLLHERIGNVDEESSLLNELVAAGVTQRMKLSNMAISLRNNVVAKTHTLHAERSLDNLPKTDYPTLHKDFVFTASKYKLVCAQLETNPRKKFKYYVGAWQIADSMLKDASTRKDVKQHVFDVTDGLRCATEENHDFHQLLACDEFVMEKLRVERKEEVFEALRKFAYETAKRACENAESFAKFGKYCYALLRREPCVVDDFISAILTGMSLGSLQATQYFPCLLKYEFYQDNERTTKLFEDKCEAVPSWLFLSWQAQIMSYLSKPFGELLVPIIKRLTSEYPKAIMYNFKQSYESFPMLKEKDNVRRIYEELFDDGRMERFINAMHRVCQPELYLRHYLLKIFEERKEDYTLGIDSLLDTQDCSLQGSLYKVLEKHQSKLEKMKILEFKTAKKLAEDISYDLYDSMKKRLDSAKLHSVQLKDYSPYLSRFSGDELEIEIPGQYIDSKRPLPQYHVTITRFDRFVRVMDSKCNPIKINLIGNDAKSYGYLVKFGEDLRQDQRLQQIFRLTNKTLEEDVKCRQRYLSVNTYHVVPLSTIMGLIQWVDETRSLREFVEFSLARNTAIENIAGMYQSWIERAKRPGRQSYKEALLKYKSKDVVAKMKELIGYVDWDCLRRSFLNISTSLQCFITLRHNFVTSYSTMCLVHWLTGVGDRHLENTLVAVKTGKCCGIDFGAAFGAGVDQSVPELVPFRLTPQILGLFQPFDEQALFGITMTHVLSALRVERGPILAFLDTFVYEPIDWSKYARNKLKQNEEDCKDVRWLPKKRIAVIEQKLNGVKPSRIMVEELANMHDDAKEDSESEYFLKYKLIVNGEDHQQVRIRSSLKNEALTPKEQVQCLLDQATDLNLLGRMWVGWCPFV